jgi:hypothetical protein
MSGHPSLAWVPDLDLARRRLAAGTKIEGVPWPEVAAAALVARGALGLDRATWAERLQVDEAVVTAVEAGVVAEPDVPPALVQACGLRSPRGARTPGSWPDGSSR